MFGVIFVINMIAEFGITPNKIIIKKRALKPFFLAP